MTEVAGQAVGDVERRRRDAAQRDAECDSRLRLVQPRRSAASAAARHRAAVERGERERRIAELPDT